MGGTPGGPIPEECGFLAPIVHLAEGTQGPVPAVPTGTSRRGCISEAMYVNYVCAKHLRY